MQPKWITTRKPNKAEVAHVQDINRRHDKTVKVGIATSEIYRPRELRRPSPEATKKVENVLTRCASLELPEQANMAASIVLNKLDKLPPLRERASTQERTARKELPALVALLNASVDALNVAHEAGDLKRAGRAWGFACNIIGKLEAMFDLPEISAGRHVLDGAAKGGREKVRQSAHGRKERRQKIRAYVADKHARGLSINAACRDAAANFDLSARQIKRELKK